MPRPDPPLWRGWALALLLGGALLAGCVESPPPRAAANPAATAQGLWESPQEAPHPLEGSWAGRGLKLTGAPGVEADTLVLYPTARTPWIVEGPVSVSTPQGTAVEVAAVHLVPFREPVTVGRVTGRASVALDAGGTLRLGESGERVALGFEEPLLLRGTVTLPDYSGPATVRAPRGILSLEGPLPAVFSGNLTLEVAPSGDADAMQGKRASRLQIEPASSGQGVEQITMRGHSLGGIVAIDLVQGRLQVGPGGVAHLMGEAVQAISADRALLGCRLQVLDPPVSVEARAGERAHLVLQVVVSGEGSAVNPTVRVLELTTPVGLLPGPAMATPPTNVTDTRRGDGGLEGWVPGTTVWFPLTLQAPARAIPAGAMTLVVEAENCRSEAVVIAVAPSSP